MIIPCCLIVQSSNYSLLKNVPKIKNKISGQQMKQKLIYR